MRCRAEVLALALALALASCGGLVESPPSGIDVPARGSAVTDDSCVLGSDSVSGFVVDDAAIYRLELDCRAGKGGSVVVREDRATGARAIVADGVWGKAPLLAGSAVVLSEQDRLRRVDTTTGSADEIALKPQRLASDGAATFAAISGGANESRYAVLRVGASGDPSTVGTIPATYQLAALAASGGEAFATLWTVCDGASSCAGIFAVGARGVTRIAALPVADVGVTVGPLAVLGERAVTSAGDALVEASSASATRELAKLGGASVVSIALAPGGRTFACVSADVEQRVVEVKDGALVPLAVGACGALTWSAGELFWEKPETRERYGHPVVVSTVGRAKTD